jgi:hypothetical protein
MEYRTGRTFTGLKRLWRLRYRFYAVLVIFFSVFIVTQDTTNAVKTLVSSDSLTYQVTASTLFAKQIVAYQAGEKKADEIGQVVYRGENALYIDANKKLVTEGKEYQKIKNYGFVLRPPAMNYALLPVAVPVNPGDPAPPEPEPSVVTIAEPLELNDIIRAPANPERSNFVDYPRFNIKAPIQYTTPEDVYQKQADGTVDYQSPILDDANEIRRGNYTSTPILKLLLDGVVEMGGIPGVPLPGEKGNSYIVGHSSNYSSVASPYNEIFRPLVGRSQEGDIFYVYDQQGRKMKFRVFENVEIRFDDDPERAYRRTDKYNAEYGNDLQQRRVVTLQTCRTVWESGQGWVPTYRWLVRGELVVE